MREPVLTRDTSGPEANRGDLLVVDDSQINRELLKRYLKLEGHSVVTAENGRQALDEMNARNFDLVLLDIMMPLMDGYEVLVRIKAHEAWRNIPVIMISALDDIKSVVRCIKMGAEDYLPKPFNQVLLKARIGACLEKKRLRDQEIMYLRRIEAEKQKSDELLRVILPNEIIEELKSTQTIRPRQYSDVAVLFADVAGFTRYCGTHTPEEVLSNLQELVEAFEELSLAHGLQKIKTIGDAFLAVAGLLKPIENPVVNCVRCGLDMISVSKRIPSGWHIRVGIHMGPLMAGVVGHRQYLFDIWGDTVNTAQRIESSGSEDYVNLSRDAWQMAAAHFQGESMGKVRLKGKGPVELFRVKNEE